MWYHSHGHSCCSYTHLFSAFQRLMWCILRLSQQQMIIAAIYLHAYGSAQATGMFVSAAGFKHHKLSCSVYPPGVTLTVRLHAARSSRMLSFLHPVASCSAVWETGEGLDWRQYCLFKGRVGSIRTAYYSCTGNVKRKEELVWLSTHSPVRMSPEKSQSL